MPDSATISPDTYIAVQIEAESIWQESLMAWLAELPYEGFQEGAESLEAYIPAVLFDQQALEAILNGFPNQSFAYQTRLIPAQNWNQSWEAHYPPVELGQFCQVVPHFHAPKAGFQYTIHITPQMSFGTGHHETTRLMLSLLENMPLGDKLVLDMGSGTGVLGILTALQGAKSVLGIDIDQWSMENGQENILRNSVEAIMEMRLGDVSAIPDDARYHLILANINRNVLLQDVSVYAAHLASDGYLLLSGFLAADSARMQATCEPLGLSLETQVGEGDWVALRLRKTGRRES